MNTDYKVIQKAEELASVAAELKRRPVIGLDTETTGLDPHTSRLRLLQLATPQTSYLIDCFQFSPPQLAPLLEVIAAAQPIKIAHNAKFDAKFLRKHLGVRLNGVFDTYLASLLISAGNENHRHGLAAVANRFLNLQVDKEQQLSNWSGELSRHQLDYAARDAGVLLPLQEAMSAQLDKMDLLVAAGLEFDCVPAIAAMELAGVYLNVGRWRELVRQMTVARDAVADELQETLGQGAAQMNLFGTPEPVNLDSPAQIKEALDRIGIEVEDTREWTLSKLTSTHPVVGKLLEHRGLSKNLSSFGENILEFVNPATGRIHADFRQIGTPTGRITTSSPSLQQIPHTVEYRSCFRAPEGRKLVVADYSQIEMRILADMANDEALLTAFRSGADLHRSTASQMLGIPLADVSPRQRESAKGLNYGLVYGMGAEGLAGRIGVSVKEAETLIERYFKAYAGVAHWLHEAGETAVREREARTASGRLWRFSLDPADRSQQAALRRVGKNAPIQGTSSDIFKRAMRLLDETLLGLDARIVNAIHDELVIECDSAIAEEVRDIVRFEMIAGAKEFLRRVPVEVEAVIADAWLKK
ncbi:MAG TPA: bifunctional 3'-5' exonuclease/DNA polymerase [Blastocatellia bacterium]|nr:bifunctional 3'-5' exonuclease/DNA polymerase [Blastocatellia bacterium]HMV82487.1 bifunctional 3'-5' exonuclease/DNA polymerase [Blastocatellia bacterium]HMZ18474.1 bifunctional 3'-5' exonuclease/DNA polymerase [Blastocatellia bacterium]HNG34838.1 bifunctional 3'-5' exonuclease/DNA polymerase [Blastocatellia bacterium]